MSSFYEFFAGGGMARAGLGAEWKCLFANDFDKRKASSYAANWGGDHLVVKDVAKLSSSDLPAHADLAWASFPCQDLSLAGNGAGLEGERSGTFWPFWKLMKQLDKEMRAPRLVVLENVCGALFSHDGKDFASICSALTDGGYRFGAVVINAVHFVPQSRPRLFIIGIRESDYLPCPLVGEFPSDEWHPAHLIKAYCKLSLASQKAWVWWNLPEPPNRAQTFAEIVEDSPTGVDWHTAEQTKKLLSLMDDVNAAKVAAAKKAGCRMVGTIYKRTRANGTIESAINGLNNNCCVFAGSHHVHNFNVILAGSIMERKLSVQK